MFGGKRSSRAPALFQTVTILSNRDSLQHEMIWISYSTMN